MFKATALVLSLLVSFSANAACKLISNTTSIIQEARRTAGWDGWRFSRYDEICEKLRKANAQLVIRGDATVLNGVNIAWAIVEIADINPLLTSGTSSSNTRTNKMVGSQDEANKLLIESIEDAANGLSIDNGIRDLQQARATFRKVK